MEGQIVLSWPQVLIAFLGSGTIGAIVVKLVDFFLVQRALENAEKRKWLRDKRFESYSQIARELLSFGFCKKKQYPVPRGQVLRGTQLIETRSPQNRY